jgi:hypothetical protein
MPGSSRDARGTVSGMVFVDVDGVGGRCSDARSAGQASSATTPWCTLGHALAAAPAGATVITRGGRYPSLDVSGRRRREYLTIQEARGEAVRLAGLRIGTSSYLRLRGITFDGPPDLLAGATHIHLQGITTSRGLAIRAGASYVAITGSNISNPCGYGIVLSAGPNTPTIDNVAIVGNHLHRIGEDGIQAKRFRNLRVIGNEIEGVARCTPTGHSDVLQTVHGGDRLTVANNFIHDNAAGLLVKDGTVTNLVIQNNLIVHGHDQFAANIYGAPGLRMLNNTVWDNKHGVAIKSGTTQATIVNNILQSLSTTDGSSYRTEDFNLLSRFASRQGDTIGRHDRFTDTPGFINAARFNYHLTRTSPAIDGGTMAHSAPRTDREGKPRRRLRARSARAPSPVDIGAYEYQP